MTKVVYGSFPFLKAVEFNSNEETNPPLLPSSWTCTALLHPFAPPADSNQPTNPFFQLCIASITFIENEILSVQLTGLQYGTWWYKITSSQTILSIDKGITWTELENVGWTLPTSNWLGEQATYFKTSYLNWMEAQKVDWWTQPVENSNAATWIWFDTQTKLPFRMMFGAAPPTSTTGDPNQLAFFQNFSFTYFSKFEAANDPTTTIWEDASIQGFNKENPFNYKLIEWNHSFSMTTIMTPVDSKSMPLPTCVLYHWKSDEEYKEHKDRTQCTIMSQQYNPQAGFATQVAMLYGRPPADMPNPPTLSRDGYIFNETVFFSRGYPESVIVNCRNIGLGQQPPTWASIPAVQGTIHATLIDNPVLCPHETVNIISALFPPTAKYPQGRYLWTWYSLLADSDGSQSRPITFMESASEVSDEGTSLALADYFEWVRNPEGTWFDKEYFELPTMCLHVPKRVLFKR